MKRLSSYEADLLVMQYGYEDYSEPMAEYYVLEGGSLEQTPTSNTLIGVKRNGRWGWIDSDNHTILPFVFDSGFVTCYNGIILLQKDGKWGGVYRNDLKIAFDFQYGYLGHIYHNTYTASKVLGGLSALVKPGDVMLTGYRYGGFFNNGNRRYTKYVRTGLFGIQLEGEIDLETGREIS